MTTTNQQIQLPLSEIEKLSKVYQVSLFSESFLLSPYPIKELPLYSSTKKSVILVTRRSEDDTSDDAVLVRNSWISDKYGYFMTRKEAEAFWKSRLENQIKMAEKRILEAKEAIDGLEETSSSFDQ